MFYRYKQNLPLFKTQIRRGGGKPAGRGFFEGSVGKG